MGIYQAITSTTRLNRQTKGRRQKNGQYELSQSSSSNDRPAVDRGLPKADHFGDAFCKKASWRRLKKGQEDGVWGRIVKLLRDRAYKNGKISLESASIDSKTIEAKKGGSA